MPLHLCEHALHRCLQASLFNLNSCKSMQYVEYPESCRCMPAAAAAREICSGTWNLESYREPLTCVAPGAAAMRLQVTHNDTMSNSRYAHHDCVHSSCAVVSWLHPRSADVPPLCTFQEIAMPTSGRWPASSACTTIHAECPAVHQLQPLGGHVGMAVIASSRDQWEHL